LTYAEVLNHSLIVGWSMRPEAKPGAWVGEPITDFPEWFREDDRRDIISIHEW
jgi:hypothetical protein